MSALSSVDWASEILAAQLVVADIEAAVGSQKGKAPLGSLASDGVLALNEQLRAARSHLSSLGDYCVAQNLAQALRLDQVQLDTLSSINEGEQDDHLAALALSRGQSLPAPTSSQQFLGELSPDQALPIRSNLDDLRAPPASAHSISSLLSKMTIGKPAPQSVSRANPSSSAPVHHECVICGDPIRAANSFHAPCTHRYCRGCIVDLVETATRDEALFPLRCCHQNFELADIRLLLTPHLFRRMRDKALEFGTPSSNRVYCTNATCSAFLGPASYGKMDIVCPQCQTIVCSACKNAAHPNDACTENAATQEVRALARALQWQTCPNCQDVIELNQGCFHITCRCRTSFCYLCTAPWKTCDCRQWDETRLIDAAERQITIEFGANVMRERPAVHAERVQQRIERLRVNHDCVNHSWAYRHGGGYCDGCNFNLPTFMMRCTDCQTLACKRCSRNRF